MGSPVQAAKSATSVVVVCGVSSDHSDTVTMRGVVAGVVLLASLVTAKHKGPHYKVHCTKDNLRVDVVKHEEVSDIYLQHLKDYPDPACKPEVVDNRATFNLKLSNIYQCMVTKVLNKNTGRTVYYHRVVMEYNDSTPKQAFLVKCDMGLTPTNTSSYDSEVSEVSLVKRQADFPVNFREDADVVITGEVTGQAPIPVLNVGVRQAGTLIDDELNVKPGTPLNMEVYLDSESSEVYGLMVTGMEVTDTREQTEPILVNGCSVDPYLFENFVTTDGDYLKAKFRAFKFPESSFVLFKGTVNVCLDTCSPVQCSNGQRGYGRRRRAVTDSGDPNKVYEISMSTVIKMECDDCEKAKYIEKGSLREKLEFSHADEAALSALFEEFGSARYAYFEPDHSGAKTLSASIVSAVIVLACLLLVR